MILDVNITPLASEIKLKILKKDNSFWKTILMVPHFPNICHNNMFTQAQNNRRINWGIPLLAVADSRISSSFT